MHKNWVYSKKTCDNIIEQLLSNRRIPKAEWPNFLKPDFQLGLHDPFLMKGMAEAVERIELALKRNETVGIFGDYDADGIPGLALFYEAFKKIGLNVIAYVPARELGYGLNQEGVDLFSKSKVSLMVTVDLGIRDFEEIDYAKSLGIDTIVVDHHETGTKLPKAIILNPKQNGDKYPFRELAGCGVAFKFVQAISKICEQIDESYLKWLLDFVAIATICDIVPLVDENRIFAKFGLIVLGKTKRIGLKKLYQVSAIDPEKIDTYSVGFQIGPRLNAPGRMEHANESFYLLISQDPSEAEILAEKLDKINQTRQDELGRVLKEAKAKVIKNCLNEKKVIMVEGESWPHGIIGLVAGKLMEEYARPVIVCEKRKKDFRASARSIEAYNIIEALEESKEYLTTYGGHAKAAGLNFEHQHLSELYTQLLKIAESKLTADDLVPKLRVDAVLEKKDVGMKLYNEISQFEPFGFGNPRPVFVLKKAKVSEVRTVGQEGKHLKLMVENNQAIGFDLGPLAPKIKSGSEVDIAFSLDENTWNNETKLQLKIIDIKF